MCVILNRYIKNQEKEKDVDHILAEFCMCWMETVFPSSLMCWIEIVLSSSKTCVGVSMNVRCCDIVRHMAKSTYYLQYANQQNVYSTCST